MMKDDRSSPVLSPPPTEFPYPTVEDEKPGDKDIRQQSDTTLHESSEAMSDSRLCAAARFDPPRPDLNSRRVETERPKPVGHRASIFAIRRRATGGEGIRQTQPSTERLENGSTLSSSASSLEDGKARRSWTQAEYQGPGMSRLNQVQGHIRHRAGGKDKYGQFALGEKKNKSTGKVRSDGRLAITVNEKVNSGYLAKALGLTLQHHLRPLHRQHEEEKTVSPELKAPATTSKYGIPRLNIVIMVIGSRGDIQPFLKIGKILKEKHGHRVRIATHPAFKQFVQEDIGLEFFSVGGDPSELMAFMVKNPGLIPSLETVRAGEVRRRRESMFEMFQGFWRACVNATDDEKDVANLKMMGDRYPFIADAIIANPPSFAHFHCAERLGIPLHLVFTFPYTPTQQFPHPLANIKASNVDTDYTNFMSYPLVELMTWQGLGDLVNRFRVKTLGLEPVSTLWAPGQLFRLKVPYTYLWSPSLVPKPPDWGPEIDIAGFVFLDLASSYRPPQELVNFLEGGEEPIYIGFGSISGMEDPHAFTKMIFGAVEKAGVRALISKGWGDMGKGMDIPDNILLLDNVPHDWLFPKVRAVVHHGGAGTTARGLLCGKPTMIVPFFGDQPFWGAMVAAAGAGAKQCLPLKKLNVDRFAEGIKQCLTDEARQKAQEIAKCIEKEGDGAENAVNSFHRSLPLDGEHSLRCFVFPGRVAVWRYKQTHVHLSALAADLLVESGKIQWRDLRLLRHYEWNDFQGPGEPITGAGGAIVAGIGDFISGLSSIGGRAKRGLQYREKQKRRKQRRTVANAIAIPGAVAHQRFNLAAPQADRIQNRIDDMEEVNLHGVAAPPAGKLQSFALTSTNPAPEGLVTSGDITIFAGEKTSEMPDPPSIPMTVLKAAAQGFGHSGKALLRLPVDFWYALALGFHNAPRLYGDGSVRPAPHIITGFRSGLKAAGNEFAYGFSDGITGLVRLPRHDMEEDGAFGLLTGLGKGMGGLVLKPVSGVVGLGGFTAKGVETGLRKRVRDTGKTDRWIRRGRMNQAQKDIRELREKKSRQEKEVVLEEARSQALRAWAMHEEHQVETAAKEKERKKSCKGKGQDHGTQETPEA
ncbi:hypothetical protein GJ744_000267 [Endocarpon pusillum]|uniref:Glycosyltransferase family 28 N-terminal domain-containing protein n=1 Tax=Endocarpon pusillum TaxID=364733 RepID=A0A8H7ANW4_9EURO|nr:hypothetical protein GJ744_000267 [Endocarpon pusillum]